LAERGFMPRSPAARGPDIFSETFEVAGSINAGTKDFKIEHRSIRSTYYLTHASVESSVVYKIDPSKGTVTKFITTHIWGP
jgi:hypothetical protein